MTPMGRGLALMLILISKPRHGNNVFSNIEFPDNCHCKQVATQNVLIQQLRTNHIVPKYLPDGIFRNNWTYWDIYPTLKWKVIHAFYARSIDLKH